MVKLLVDKHNWKEALPIVVMHYRDMELMNPGSDLLTTVRRQYADMASGGNGGLVEPQVFDNSNWPRSEPLTIRASNYPDTPDEFFQELCDLLGWAR